jgi:hypothetical protein
MKQPIGATQELLMQALLSMSGKLNAQAVATPFVGNQHPLWSISILELQSCEVASLYVRL